MGRWRGILMDLMKEMGCVVIPLDKDDDPGCEKCGLGVCTELLLLLLVFTVIHDDCDCFSFGRR